MNKYLSVLMIFALSIFIVSACGNSDKSDSQATSAKQTQNDQKSKDNQTVKVDKGLLTVKVTIPKSLFDPEGKGVNMDQIIADAKKSGIKDVIKNDDDTLTYVMSKATHKKLMSEYKGELLKDIKNIKTSGDYPSIKDIKYNDSFTKFNMVVDQKAFENSFDGFAGLNLALTGLFYQLFDGATPDTYKVTINVQNQSGKVFDTTVYPDAFKDTGSN